MSAANIYDLFAPLAPNPGGLIWAYQNGPRPGKPYATVNVRTQNAFLPVKKEPDALGNEEYSQLIRKVVEFEVYGRNALDLAENAGLKIRTDINALRAELLGLGVGPIVNARSVPELLNQSQYEERAILEVIIYDSDMTSDASGLIETIEIEGETEGQAAVTSGFCTITVENEE